MSNGKKEPSSMSEGKQVWKDYWSRPPQATPWFEELTLPRVTEILQAEDLSPPTEIQQLESAENRVFLCTLADTGPVVLKFYRPDGWGRSALLEEHRFLQELLEEGLQVPRPLPRSAGETLHPWDGGWFAIFDFMEGQETEEETQLQPEQVQQVLEAMARLHQVGRQRKGKARPKLTPAELGRACLEFILEQGELPNEVLKTWREKVETLLQVSELLFEEVQLQRVHGDLGLNNLLWNAEGPVFLDFDDMCRAPRVQDLWMFGYGLKTQGIWRRDGAGPFSLRQLLDWYEAVEPFPRNQLALIEPLRALRLLYFEAWFVARRGEAFIQDYHADEGSVDYWTREIGWLELSLQQIQDETWRSWLEA